MYNSQIEEINRDLRSTKKAIISLGCSFVEGQGAVDQNLYESFEWTMERTGVPMQPILTISERNELLKKYSELISWQDNSFNWTFMEMKNAFVNVLCKKYFEGRYTPINFGLRGRGNRASIKSLYFWPQIDWNSIEEMIVIYVPSGQERFDFVNDYFNDNSQFQCMWPHWKDQESDPRKSLWKGYGEGVYSNKSAALEQISNINELKNFCEVKKAKLVITPAFDKTYNRSSMLEFLKNMVCRDTNQTIIYSNTDPSKFDEVFRKRTDYPIEYVEILEKIVDTWPWELMFRPESCETFIDLSLKQENLNKPYDPGFWDYNGIGTKNKWVTVCCHPSAKAHDLFAMRLYEHISKL